MLNNRFLSEEQEREVDEGKNQDRKNRYLGSWKQLSHRTLFMTRYYIPEKSQDGLTKEGRVEVGKLQEPGMPIEEHKAGEMSNGMGGGNKIRFWAERKARRAEASQK